MCNITLILGEDRNLPWVEKIGPHFCVTLLDIFSMSMSAAIWIWPQYACTPQYCSKFFGNIDLGSKSEGFRRKYDFLGKPGQTDMIFTPTTTQPPACGA
jgi:hypothetical protein